MRYSGQGASQARLDEVLVQVGLKERAQDKYKKYSLGMKQRLGVAAALIKDPRLLVLDEPTNGLDPKGMAEMRNLIRELGRGQRTVLLSSHLMGEVEQVCDRASVIREGKLVAEGTIPELRGESGVTVKADPLQKAAEVAEKVEGVDKVEVDGDALRIKGGPEVVPALGRALVASDVDIRELRSSERSLEDAFFELTGAEDKEEDHNHGS